MTLRKQWKGAVVEWVEHRNTKRRAPIRLDKSSMTFFAWEKVEDMPTIDPFHSKDGGEVRAWLYKQLARTSGADALDWQPVIDVRAHGDRKYRYRDDDDGDGQEIEVEIARYWIALTRDGREWRKLKWAACDPDSAGTIPESERYAASDRYADGPKAVATSSYVKPTVFRLPSVGERGGRNVLLYTPELWRALKMVVKQVEASRRILQDLVGTKAGIATLAEVGAGKTPLQIAATAKDAR